MKKETKRCLKSIAVAAGVMAQTIAAGSSTIFAAQMPADGTTNISKTSDYLKENLNFGNTRKRAKTLSNEDSEKEELQTSLISEYDANGLARTYHYVTLDYTLVEQSAVSNGATMDDVWANTPESVIAMYTEYSNVYAVEGNDQYLVAFLNPGGLNGMQLKSVSADFTDNNIYEPEIYNDMIRYDAETGIAYIPKAFYYNEEGNEILKPLIAQTLVPYSFENDKANQILVTLEDQTGTMKDSQWEITANALDVDFSISLPENIDAEQNQIEVYMNDEKIPLESGANYQYDRVSHVLKINRSGLTMYSIRVVITDLQKQELAKGVEREILVASTGDLGILLADNDGYEKPYSYDGMTAIPENGLKLDYKNLKAGQLYPYKGICSYFYPGDTASVGSNAYKLVKSTYPYCYYGILDETGIYNNVMNNVSLDTAIKEGLIGKRTNLTEGGEAWKLYNVSVSLPDMNSSVTDNATVSSSDGIGTTTWTASLNNLSGYPEGFFNQLILHCAHPTAGISVDGSKDSDTQYSNQTMWARCLYVYESDRENYSVWSFLSPDIESQQAGCGIYKIYSQKTEEPTYVKMGLNKKDDQNEYVEGAGYLIFPAEYGYDAAGIHQMINTARKDTYDNAKSDISSVLQTKGVYATFVKTDASGTVKSSNRFNSENTTCFYVAEFFSPSGYDMDSNVYKVEVNPNVNADLCTIKDVKKGYDGGESLLSFSAGNVYVTAKDNRTSISGRFYVRKKSSDGTEIADKSGFTFTVYESLQDAKDKKGGVSSTTIASGSTKDWFSYSWKKKDGATKTVYVRETAISSGNSVLYTLSDDIYAVTMTGNEDIKKSTIAVKKYTKADNYAKGTDVAATNNNASEYVYYEHENTPVPVSGRFYVRKKSSDGTEIADKSGFTFTVYESLQDAKDKKGGVSSTTIASGSTKDWFSYSWKKKDGATKTVYVRETAISSGNSVLYTLSDDIYAVTMTGNEDIKKSTIAVKKYTKADNYAKGTDVAATNNNASEYVYYEHANTPVYLHGKVEFQKVDENGKPLDGVIFDLFADQEMNKKITSLKTENGKASYSITGEWKASEGAKTIYVKENEDAAGKLGLVPDTNLYRVTITGNTDTEKCAVSCEKVSGNYTPVMTKTGNGYALKAVNHSTSVEIDKLDLADGKPVIGATLSIYQAGSDGKKTGNALCTWETDGTSKKISRLPEGNYILSETGVPNGYLGAEDVPFAISRNQTMVKLTMKDARPYGVIGVVKKNELGNALSGAKFAIYLNGKEVDQFETDRNGKGCSKQLPVDERGSDGKLYAIKYELREIEAPEGYMLENGADTITFSLTDTKTEVQIINKNKTNKAKQELPVTGGTTRMAASLLSGTALLAALFFFIAGMKKTYEKKKKN